MVNRLSIRVFLAVPVLVGLFVVASSSAWAQVCGNGICSITELETCQTCPQDCGSCTAPLPVVSLSPTTSIPPLASGAATPPPTPSPTTAASSPQSSPSDTSSKTSTPAPGTNNPQASQSRSSRTGPTTPTTAPANAPAVIPVVTRQLTVIPTNFPDGRIVLPNEDVELIFTPDTFGAAKNGWVIIFPSVDTKVVFNFSALLDASTGTPRLQLPAAVTLEKPIGQEKLTIVLPKDVVITTGKAINGEAVWDGKFNGPTIMSAPQACDSSSAVAVEIGRLDRQLLFQTPVSLQFSGQPDAVAKYCFNQLIQPIAVCPSQTEECYISENDQLEVQTKHFTQFLVYTQTNWYVWGTILGVALLLFITFGVYLFRRYRASAQVQQSVPKVVHELRTPLTAIKGYLSMILQGNYGSLSQAQKGPLVNVMSSTQRLSSIVNDMLDESSLEAGKIKLRISDFAVDGVVQEVLASLQPLAKEKNLALTSSSSGGAIVLGDRDRVRQILTNLIGNSIKFTDKGSIHISSASTDQVVNVFVTNTGPAMTAEQQQKLFKRFEQLGTKASGTGLGLYVSRELARAMGGDLWLEKSVSGEGTTFAFSLPLANLLPQKES